MSTGIQGSISGVATLTYTPVTAAKVLVAVSGAAGTITINGAGLVVPATITFFTLYVGANQTLTIVGIASMVVQVSSLES